MSLVSYPSSCPFILNSETSFRATCKAGLMIINSLSYCLMGFPGGSDSKESACNARDLVWSFGWKDPLEEGMATHSSILAWRIPWTEEPGGLQSMGSQRVRHRWATKSSFHRECLNFFFLFERPQFCWIYNSELSFFFFSSFAILIYYLTDFCLQRFWWESYW